MPNPDPENDPTLLNTVSAETGHCVAGTGTIGEVLASGEHFVREHE